MIPKFRAWDKKNEAMLHKVRISTYIDETMVEIANQWHWVERSFSDVILMQSTGAKDKNSVEIYEGDIVKISQQRTYDKYIPNKSVNEIVYKDSAFCVKETRGTSDIDWPIIAGLYYKTNEEFEVIGNIHENPELLEVPNE